MILQKETALFQEGVIREIAEQIQDTRQFFWTDSSGAHITQDPQEDFIQNPSGGNTLIDSSGMKVRDGTDVLAEFTAEGAQIGKDTEQHTQMMSNGLFIKDAEGNDTGKIYHTYLENVQILIGSVDGSKDPIAGFTHIDAYNTFEMPSNAKNGTTITCYINAPDYYEVVQLQFTAGTAASGTYGTSFQYTYDGARFFKFLAVEEWTDGDLYGIQYTIETRYLPNMKVGSDVWLGQQITSGLPNSFVRVDNGNVRIFNTPQFRKLNEVFHEGSIGYTNSLMINGRDMFGGGKVLWRSSGGYYVTDQQIVSLNEPISSQPHGIILAWSSYDPTSSTARNYGWHFDFIPKFYLDFSEGSGDWGTWYGQGVYIEAPDSLTNNTVRRKYIYISDDSITGHANNSASGTGYANNHMVLRYVVGI